MNAIIDSPAEWTRGDLDQLIGQPESFKLEFKRLYILAHDPTKLAEELTAEVSAFANTEGGTIVIGIAERKVGKTRVADHVEDDIATPDWPPSRLQRVIEGNLSPSLPGLRVRAIQMGTTDEYKAFVIVVPQGTTAHQASDFRYYGRSEYECKPLRDYDIRLRMARARTPRATITASGAFEWRMHEVDLTVEEIRAWSMGNRKLLTLATGKLVGERAHLALVEFSIFLENTGEVNITEFKVSLSMTPDDLIDTPRYVQDFRDRMVDSRDMITSLNGQISSVNVYPQDAFRIVSPKVYVNLSDVSNDIPLRVIWTLFLPNSSPAQGELDLAGALKEVREKGVS